MIKVENITKQFESGDVVTKVLRGISFEVPVGQFVAITGSSGAGKSTLLYQLGLLDKPNKGKIWINDQEITGLDETEAVRFRLKHFGFVFQDYALFPELTATENVILPELMQGVDYKKSLANVDKIFSEFSLDGLGSHLPSQLSGGQQQRVSVARAMAKNPEILFADEPTANLDSAMSNQLMKVILKLNKKGQTVIMVTHEEEFARMADRIITIKDGLIEKDQLLTNK